MRALKINVERRAATELAGEGDVAAALLEDAITHGETQAFTFAGFLGGEKGLEQLGLQLLGNSATGIGDGDQHVIARSELGIARGGGGIDSDVGGFDDELAAARHGVAGIVGEADEDFLELAGVGPGPGLACIGKRNQGDGTAKQLAQPGFGAANGGVHIEQLRLEDLFAAEGEELAGEGRGGRGGFSDFGGALVGEGLLLSDLLDEFRMADDGGQQRIEIVGDATGELADGFHFAGFDELLLALAQFPGAFGDEDLKAFHFYAGFAAEAPFLGEGVGKLKDFDGIEGFLEDEHPVAASEPGDDFVERVIGIGRADDDLKVGILFPNPVNGFDPIPTGRHPEVHEGHRVRASFRTGSTDLLEAFLALECRVDFEVALDPDPDGLAEELRGGVGHCALTRYRRAEDFAEVLMDRLVVVDEQDASVLWDG